VKRIALLALLSAGLLLPGCGGDDQDQKPPAGGGKKLTFWHIQTKSPMKDVVAAAVKRAEGDDLSVKVSPIENDAFKNKLRVNMGAGSPPDLFHTWGGGALAADARAGRVLDLTGRVPEKHLARLNSAALDFCRADGKLYALPADVAAVVFWYNREIFAKHKLSPPKTWKDFLAACQKLKVAGVTPVALGNADSWPGAFYFIYFALRLGGKEPFAAAAARKAGKGFEHESFLKAGEMVLDLAKSGYLSGDFNGKNYSRMRDEFFRGKSAMILMGPWILGNARKEAPAGFVAKMGCFAFPAVEGGKGEASLVVGGVNAAYAVAQKCAAPKGAVRVLTELTSEKTAGEWGKTGRIPALRADLAAKMLPPETREVAAILGAAGGIQLYYDQALPPELAQVHKSTTQGLFAGSKTPAEAARVMEEKARAFAKRRGK
jgi:raffinose/stachyose/melibiose transport system substrate-binding protein